MWHKFFNEWKGVRRTLQIVTIILIAYATVRVFWDMGAVSASVAGAYSTLLVAFAVNSGLYTWTRGKKDVE